MLTLEEKEIVKNKIRGLVKESLYEFFTEKSDEDENDDDYDYDDDDDSDDEYEKEYGKDDASRKEINVISALDDANDGGIGSFNLTRSQIAYKLWPDLDKDAARSKLSQKINGEKNFKPWEINDIYNMINNVTA